MTSRSLKLTSECSCVYSLNLSNVGELSWKWISKFKRKKKSPYVYAINITWNKAVSRCSGGHAVKEMCKKLDACAIVCAIYLHFRTEGKLGLVKHPKGLLGCLPFNKNFRINGSSETWYRNLPEKFPDIPETVEFRKGEPFNRKFLKFREQSWMERKLPGKICRKSGYTSGSCPILWFHLLLEVAR